MVVLGEAKRSAACGTLIVAFVGLEGDDGPSPPLTAVFPASCDGNFTWPIWIYKTRLSVGVTRTPFGMMGHACIGVNSTIHCLFVLWEFRLIFLTLLLVLMQLHVMSCFLGLLPWLVSWSY